MSEVEMKNEETSSAPTPAVAEKPKAVVSMPTDWSWGGFMFGPAYLIAVKKYQYLLGYLLMLIPIINFVAMIGIAIYLGIKGHTLVVESPMFANNDERAGFNRAIDHAGRIMFFVSLACAVIALIFASLFVGLMVSLFGGPQFGGMPMR
ncbi:MAG: hypothetical protein HGB03_00330 [Candidatus Yonathbacteria bacterium]|nr:hypothetical protein [Candidatus Yonathbacteria bacterium]NTW47713.1 hypothetical protein [Candidatus Yonathbacteria bacterium]